MTFQRQTRYFATKPVTHAIAVVASLLALSGACLAADPATESSAAQAQPNVLFLAIDDLNDWVGCLGGHPQAQTPNIDRLAARGVNFTNAHCQAPICNPSRLSLLSGLLPSTTGVYYLAPKIRDCETTKGVVTLIQHFERNGYQTLGAGKIFHSGGVDEFQMYGGHFGGFGPTPPDPISGGHTHPLWDWGAYPERDQQMPDYKIADWAIEQINEPRDKPFFLAAGFYRPHVPMQVPQKWFDRFPRAEIQLPAHLASDLDDVPQYGQDLSWSAVAPRHAWMVEHNEWKRAVQSYLACGAFVDAQVGRVLDALAASPHADDTLVVLWSDHGFHLGTKERWGKRSLWEPSTRVVLMMAGPGVHAGGKCDRPVGLIDIYPTLNEVCNLPEIADLEGHSLAPSLANPHAPRRWPTITTFGQHNHAVRSQRWRYITYADGSQELYDHQNDPHEFTNVANDPRYEPIVALHRQYLPQVNRPMAPGSAHADARPGSPADID